VDWQATLGAGRHALRGAEALLRTCPSGRLLTCARQLDVASETVALGYGAFADGLRRHVRADVPAPALDADDWPTDLGTDLYHLADLRVWLASLGDDLQRIATRPATPSPRQVPDTWPNRARSATVTAAAPEIP
jgi:hypothetical protein